jgi:hypothetical protein
MIRKGALGLIPLLVLVAGCMKEPEPIGSATEAPGASKMADPPKRSRPDVPGIERASGSLSGK